MTHARTRLLALLGRPVSHSRSPAMMTRALDELGRGDEFSYLAFDVAPESLGECVRALSLLGCAGANVTVPHKRAVLDHCSWVDEDARRIGAANVLAPVSGGFSAHNTDAPAAARALTDAGVSLAGARVLLVGAGGAARAVAVGLAREGCRAITVVARDEAQARGVLAACDGLAVSEREALPWQDEPARRAHAQADILVQCTPMGMRSSGVAPEEYAQCRRWLESARAGAAAMDLVYSPARTPWLESARARGARPVDGLGMLAHQGALALARWCGGAPAARALRRFLDELEAGGIDSSSPRGR